MSVLKEFREFAFKGNMIDLAVGVIIGAAFGKIISSMVEDLVMPIIGLFAGKLDFANHYIALSDKIAPGLSLADAKKLGAVFAWGNFLTALINFIVIALAIFVVVKAINAARRRFDAEKAVAEAVAPSEPPQDIKLLTEIRDLLGKR